jgi:hypothetical protein
MILDTEAAVIANFEFLSQTDVDMDDDDDMSDDLEPPDDDDQDDVKTAKRKGKVRTFIMRLTYLHAYKMTLHVRQDPVFQMN